MVKCIFALIIDLKSDTLKILSKKLNYKLEITRNNFTFEKWTYSSPAGYSAFSAVLAQSEFHIKQRYTSDQQHNAVWNKESTYNIIIIFDNDESS